MWYVDFLCGDGPKVSDCWAAGLRGKLSSLFTCGKTIVLLCHRSK